jgi:hypothetical protein
MIAYTLVETVHHRHAMRRREIHPRLPFRVLGHEHPSTPWRRPNAPAAHIVGAPGRAQPAVAAWPDAKRGLPNAAR